MRWILAVLCGLTMSILAGPAVIGVHARKFAALQACDEDRLPTGAGDEDIERGAPAVITADNGSEFYSRTTDSWACGHGVRLDFSRQGKPMDNPFIERFNGRLRDEHLNAELFFSVADAKAKILEWQRDYNEVRTHSPLGPIFHREFAAAWQLLITRTARGEILNLETVQK